MTSQNPGIPRSRLLRALHQRDCAAERQDLRQAAEGGGDPRADLQGAPEHPGLAHYLIHSYDRPRSPTALPAARATRRSRRTHRTRCTCPRTPSRASATGRIRSTPTARRPTPRARRTPPPKCFTRSTTGYAYLQTAQDRANKVLAELAQTVATVNTARADGPAPITLSAASRRATRSNAGVERSGRALRGAHDDVPVHRRDHVISPGRGRGAEWRVAAAKEDVEKLAALHASWSSSKDEDWAQQVDIQRRWRADGLRSPKSAKTKRCGRCRGG